MSDLIPTDAIRITNGVPTTTSLMVAQVFGKNHADVMRSIRKKISNFSKSFVESNFALNEYVDSIGKSNAMYELSRNGFAILALGFTGKIATEFQEAFMNEFDRRGEVIANMNQMLPKPKRKNKYRYGFYQVEATPDGKTKTTWKSGVKTIEDMNEIENLSRLQADRVRKLLGIARKFIEDLCEDVRYNPRYLALLELLENEKSNFRLDNRQPLLTQKPLFDEVL
ncbi:MAG: Rha family transcriptional regulator [Pseudobacteriovorax sp.]|nr:Rha family transcriptional regulator [Pseudobacteriovorax sp.]